MRRSRAQAPGSSRRCLPRPPLAPPELLTAPGGGGADPRPARPHLPAGRSPPRSPPPPGKRTWGALTPAEPGCAAAEGRGRRGASAGCRAQDGLALPPSPPPPPLSPRRLSLHLQAARLRRGGRLRSFPRDRSHCGSALRTTGGAGRAGPHRAASPAGRGESCPAGARSPRGGRHGLWSSEGRPEPLRECGRNATLLQTPPGPGCSPRGGGLPAAAGWGLPPCCQSPPR